MSKFSHIFVAIGTVAVAILAIWGDWFRDRFASPKLSLKLRSSRGNMTTMHGRQALYYHLVVQNHRRWALAKGVQIMIKGIGRKGAEGTFKAESLAAEIPLTWAFAQLNPINPPIRNSKICDFGFLAANATHFQPSLYF